MHKVIKYYAASKNNDESLCLLILNHVNDLL